LEEVIARVVQLFLALTGAYALALWFALVVWTYRDITARTTNPVTHVFSTLVVVLFFVPGAIIYLILRPRETLDDAFQRTMEEEYLLQDLDDFPVCPSCRRSVRDDFLFCPHCRTELRRACIACHRLVDTRWESCPYCAAPQYEPIAPVARESISTPRSSRGSRGAGSSLQAIDGGRVRERSGGASGDSRPILRRDDDITSPAIATATDRETDAEGQGVIATDGEPLRPSNRGASPKDRVSRDRG
jgi:RNA polymerase subunit RPABC4/transcription elongation factor Spt4